MLLFLSIAISIKFASRFFKPIVNLIKASESISSGNLNAKVPIIEAEEEIDKLNKNFNLMIDRLKGQIKQSKQENNDLWIPTVFSWPIKRMGGDFWWCNKNNEEE